MFIDILLEKNPELIDRTFDLHQAGILEPDTYVIDMDVLKENAKLILDSANKKDIELYFMLKQIGRNPYIAQTLIDMGYKGAVVVDFREAEIMMDNKVPLGNVGHLVQTPKHLLKKIISYGVDVMTVFTVEKLLEINNAANELGVIQDIIIKVAGEYDLFYSGQEAGIELKDLESFLTEAKSMNNIRIVGTTSFPCFLYDYNEAKIKPTENLSTVLRSKEILEENGIKVSQVNLPSTTSVETLELLAAFGGTHGEPGHGFTGTTPAHAHKNMIEKPAVLYLSEISHNFRGKAYCYGGGHYRRSHVKDALVKSPKQDSVSRYKVKPVSDESIDYYFELDSEAYVSASVIMAFRFQIFVTRSKVALIEKQEENTRIIGIYDSLGRRIS